MYCFSCHNKTNHGAAKNNNVILDVSKESHRKIHNTVKSVRPQNLDITICSPAWWPFSCHLGEHPCPIHPNWVDSSETLNDSTRFACYISTQFTRSCISQTYFWHDKSTTGETIRVDSIESSRIKNIFNLPYKAHQKTRSVK